MDGGGSHPFRRRQNTKRNFSTMSASHRDDTPSDNEPPSRRRRVHEPPQQRLPVHYPGDGLDFRRPVMSNAAPARESSVNGMRRMNPIVPVIDLTDEDNTEESQGSERRATSTQASDQAIAGSSRAQRLPRFGRNVIDAPGAGETENERGMLNDPPPDLRRNQLALPPLTGTVRPQFAGLRRPTRPPSPPVEMDDLEFVSARPLPNRGSRNASRSRSRVPSRSRMASPPHIPATSRAPRSVTPYPTDLREHIDLTGEADDDVVHVDTRQREGGVNRDHPVATAGVGTRDMEVEHRGFGNVGNIANILREGGMQIGNRLMQRLNEYAGLDGEFRAHQQVLDHLNHNLGYPDADARRRLGGHEHHHHRHRPHPNAVPRARVRNHDGLHLQIGNAVPRAVGVGMAAMPGMMDYEMTAFDMGLGGNRPPTPKYSPPPEPETGFTRSPEEDEVVVCPNCGDELAMGDSDLKQEIWVVKTCGHAYCGECAQNRSRVQSKKGKGKAPDTEAGLPPPFKKCVVEGCGKPAAAKSMVHVYLGS